MPAAFPSSVNTYVPSHEATNKMVVDFSRNINKFPVNKYTQIVPVKTPTGYYLEMTVEEAGRVTNTAGNDFVWPDGNDHSRGLNGLESFQYKPYECVRRAFPVTLGDLTVDHASWDVLAQHTSIKSRQCMTFRTQAAITALTTSANYASDHVLAVSAISGNTGRWDQSTTARQDIKRSIITACEKILDDTLAAVDLDDLCLVINSKLAGDLSVCQEIVDYVKGTPDSLPMIRGKIDDRTFYNLPATLYGIPIIVEATRKVTTKKGATTARSQVLSATTPFITARPGALEGVEGAPSFSVCTGFFLEEMTVETKRDDDNRRTLARVVENYVYKMTAPAAGILFTGATA